ncbi:uncharacterized protein BCR38DRAFT_413754 [Pseudomassariella vexata]|uniref:Cupredoxin n=1 Tax=Pseudomassariella vexata TaxID=1141098 RepID=A0A1Y2DF03_9PEZI|nr:uncharacterized protein BCR38DRAFT_413754 [Pseudomassariella vexata]ORY57851.1 hypothetical protein BCR38DRAFT_413754 [Pseudomassariella vexata]
MGFFRSLTAIVVGISIAVAQSTTSTIESSASSSAAATHTVLVGAQHDFRPDSIVANAGDKILFKFYPQNHSVVRAEYKFPCVPYNYINPGGDTFFSGPMESQDGDDQPSWTLEVNNTEPTFFYCSAPGSCIDYAMVGVINPVFSQNESAKTHLTPSQNETMTLDTQKAWQKNVTFQLSPGEDPPLESPSASTPSGGPASETASPPASSGGGSGLSGGAIAGIAVGGAAVVIIAVALIYICGRKGGIEKGYRRSAVNPASAPMVEAQYGNQPKSPPPGSMNSPYAAAGQMDPLRPGSPAQWSSYMGSPHNSYMGHPSPGMPGYNAASSFGPGQDRNSIYEPSKSPEPFQPPPVELPGSIGQGGFDRSQYQTELPGSHPGSPDPDSNTWQHPTHRQD